MGFPASSSVRRLSNSGAAQRTDPGWWASNGKLSHSASIADSPKSVTYALPLLSMRTLCYSHCSLSDTGSRSLYIAPKFTAVRSPWMMCLPWTVRIVKAACTERHQLDKRYWIAVTICSSCVESVISRLAQLNAGIRTHEYEPVSSRELEGLVR